MASQIQSDFNYAFQAILAQGPCIENGTPVYFARGGEACAIGQLISRKEASELRGHNISTARVYGTLPDRMVKSWQFYADLQMAHDNAACDTQFAPEKFAEEFIDRMEKVAGKFGLTIPDVPVEAK